MTNVMVINPNELAAEIIHSFFKLTYELIMQGRCRFGNVSQQRYDEFRKKILNWERVDRASLRSQDERQTVKCIESLWRCEQLSQRITSFVSIAAQEGVDVALMFYASKAKRKVYDNLYNLLSVAQTNLSKAISMVNTETIQQLYRECEEGYTLTLVMVALGLSMLPGIFDNCKPNTMSDLIGCIRQAIRERRFYIHHDLAIEFLVSLKRLADAMYKR